MRGIPLSSRLFDKDRGLFIAVLGVYGNFMINFQAVCELESARQSLNFEDFFSHVSDFGLRKTGIWGIGLIG